MAVLHTKLRRDIVRQWPQFVAVTLTILLGVALFGASYDAYRNLEASYQARFDAQNFADLFVTGGNVAAIANQAEATDGVAAVTTRTQTDVPIRVGPDKLRGRVIGMPLGTPPAVNQVDVLRGHGLEADDQALVEQHMADHFHLGAGDTVAALGADGRWQNLTVAGAGLSVEYLWPARSRSEVLTLPDDFGVIFVPSSTAEALAGHGPNQVMIRLADGIDKAPVLASLSQMARTHGASEVLTRDEQPSNATLKLDLDGFNEMSVAFPLLFLGAAAMATYVLITRRVAAEREIVGMMLASGLSRGQVLRHYLGYGLAAGTVGAALGAGVGEAAARWMSEFYVGFIDLPRSVIVFRWQTVVIGIAFGMITGLVAALAPALLASRIPPAEAMRGVMPATGGRYSLAERLVPPLRRLPARWRLVLRSIGRNRRRTTYTILGVTLSLLLVLVAWTMIDTMNHLLAVQFDTVQRQDARVDFTGPASDAQLTELGQIDGVAEVEPTLTAPVGLLANDHTYGTVLMALPRNTDLHGFRALGGGTTTLPADGMLLGRAARDLLGVEVGDRVTVAVQGTDLRLPLTVRGFLDEPLGTFAYTSLDQIRSATGGQVPVTSALLKFDPGVDRAALRRTITDLPQVAAYEDAQALKNLYDQYTGLFYGFIGGMLVLGGLMAFAMIFTTMSVNIVERSREVATLRASGVRTSTISRLISSENLIMTALGIVPGLIVGVLGGKAFLQTYTNDQFRLDLVINPWTLVIASIAILVVALISQWPSLRAVKRLNIAQVVRERAQ